MASFTPEQLNTIMVRGFEGDGVAPIIPTYMSHLFYEGIPYMACNDTPNFILDIGDIDDWVSGNIHFSKLFWVSAVTAHSDDDYNNAVQIAVTIGDDGNGHGTIQIKFADEDDNPLTPSYQNIGITNGDGAFIYRGHCYLFLGYDTRDNELLFGVKYELLTTAGLDPVTTMGCFEVYGSQWTPNLPWKYWLEQNDSDFYDLETQTPEMMPGGGGGGFYRPSDTIGFSGLPSLDALDFGFMSIYKMGSGDMQSLAHYLWTSDFVTNIKKLWTDPFDNIISIAFIPLNAELTGASGNVQIGNIDTGVPGFKLSKSMYEKDFGTLNFNEIYKNFADYSPFTRLKIFLPSVGVKEINPDDYMDGQMHLMSYIDVFTGTIVYQLMSIRHGRTHVVDSYEGNIKTEIPITGRNFIDAYKAVFNGMTSLVSGGLSGGNLITKAGKINAGAVGGVANSAIGFGTDLLSIKPTYEKTGSLSGSATRISPHVPYVFFDTPQFREPTKYRHLHGYMSNIYQRIGDCKGYTEVKYMDMKNINLTDTEKEELKNILETGVYINDPPTP